MVSSSPSAAGSASSDFSTLPGYFDAANRRFTWPDVRIAFASGNAFVFRGATGRMEILAAMPEAELLAWLQGQQQEPQKRPPLPEINIDLSTQPSRPRPPRLGIEL